MNLYNLLSTIKDLSAFEMVNSAFIGDVYEVNSRQDVEYPICVLTEGTHVGNTEEDTEVYNISLFLIDRLTEDESNELDIKSWANEGIKDIINRIEETNVGIVQNGWQITTFTQRFESLCAGAYATIQIETSGNECCGGTIKMVTSINGKTGDVYIPYIDQNIVNTVNGMTGNVTIDIPTVPTNVSEFNNDAGYITDEALTDYPKREETVNVDTFNEHVNNQTVINNDVKDKIKDLQNNKANKTETVDLNTFNAHVNNQTNINNDFETDITELQTNKANKTETVNINTFNEHVNTQAVINNDVNDKITNLQNTKADITGTVSISKFNEHVDNQTIIDHDIKTQILDLQNNKADKTELPDLSIYNPTNNFKTINSQSIIGTGNIEIQGGSSAVTSVNGQTGDVTIDVPTNVSQLNNDAGYLTEHQDLSNYATKNELSEYNKTDNFKTINNQSIIGTGNIEIQGGSSAVTSVNGKTGDVVIDVPTNVSQLNNDAGYLTEHQDLSNYTTKTELSEYNKTDNFKTINNQSIIGTGNIEIQGGSSDDKMNKHHPIFNETYAVDEIKPEFRLNGYIDKIETQGTTNYNCVERWHSVDNLWVRWSLENINTYLTNNPNTQYAAVKGFCLPNSEHFGECEYHLFIENTSTGLSEQIDQYMQDRHVYGDYYESKNITLYDGAIVDSRDPNDNIIGALNQAIGSTTTCRFIRNGVTYYTPDSMSNTNLFFNDNYTLPYMTSIIDIKGILEHYSIDTYTSLRVQMKTTQLTHWHIMSCYLFFSNDTEFMKHSETSVDYVLIDELTQKATKNDLNEYNKTNNFKTINNQSIIGTGNIEIQGGSSAVTSVNGATGDVVIDIPTNVSQLNNDAGYLTEHQDLSNYATTEFVNNATNNGNIVWTGTQAEYDALSDKTVYLIYLIKK